MRRLSARVAAPALPTTAARFLKLYTNNHVWVDVAGGVATVGLSQSASQRLVFGEIVFVAFESSPLDEVTVGDEIAQVESVKMCASVNSPVSGTVQCINTAVDMNANVVETDPEGQGWLCKIKLDDTVSEEELMDEAAYARFLDADETDTASEQIR